MPPTRSRLSRITVALAALLSLAVSPSCTWKGGATQRELTLIVGAWFAGVQERNWDLLARYDASAPDRKSPEFAAFQAKVNGLLDRYESEKLQGTWQPDPDGYIPVKATLIGANPGTQWGVPGREGSIEEPVLIVQASFAYDEIGDQHLPPGTKVYVQGYPVGRVYRIEIGGGDAGKEFDVLETLRMKVFLKRVPGSSESENKYRVVRAELIDGSAKHKRVKWTS